MHEVGLGDEDVLGRAFFDAEIDHQITELFENADAHRAVESAVVFEAPYAGPQQPVGAVKQHLAEARALSSDTALGRAPLKHLPAINRQPATPQTSLDRAGPSGKSIAGPRPQSPPAERDKRAILTNPVELETKSGKILLDGGIGCGIRRQLLEENLDLRRVLDDSSHAVENLQFVALDIDLDEIAPEVGPEQIVEPPDLRLNGHVTRHRSGPVNMAAAKMALRVLESRHAVAVG